MLKFFSEPLNFQFESYLLRRNITDIKVHKSSDDYDH